MTDLIAPPGADPFDTVDGDGTVGGGRYRLGERLGRGRTSSVHVAVDERLRRRVAVRLFDSAVSADSAIAVDAVAASASTWTSGMSRVLDAGSDPGADGRERVYLVRDLVAGVSLAQLSSIVECRPATTAALGASVAVTLAALHLHGTGHGAVHGGNIFVPGFATSPNWSDDPDGGTVLTDFGLGRRRPAGCDPREDVRALGTALLGVLTGRTVIGSRTTRASLARLARRGGTGRIAPRDRPSWTEALAAMTDVDPASRPTALEAAATLATLRGGPITRL